MQSVHEIPYQTTTLDTGVIEVLYEGKDLKAASDAALAYPGESIVYHYRDDGTCVPVTSYSAGQYIRGYVYLRSAVTL